MSLMVHSGRWYTKGFEEDTITIAGVDYCHDTIEQYWLQEFL